MFPHLVYSNISDRDSTLTPQSDGDRCCGADSVNAAVASKLMSVTTLVEELARAVADPIRRAPLDYLTISTPRLVAHIVSTHHEYLRRSFASLRALSAKVRRGHADKNTRLRDLDRSVNELADVLLPHLVWEEETFFPLLTTQDPDLTAIRAADSGQPDADLQVSKLLQEILYATEDFTPPKWACLNYQTLMSQLMHLEGDLFVHAHLENQVLKRRFSGA